MRNITKCVQKPCTILQYFDDAVCWCKECSSCGILIHSDRLICEEKCAEYFAFKRGSENIITTDGQITPGTPMVTHGLSVKSSVTQGVTISIPILIFVILIVLITIVIISVSLIWFHSKRKRLQAMAKKHNESTPMIEVRVTGKEACNIENEEESRKLTESFHPSCPQQRDTVTVLSTKAGDSATNDSGTNDSATNTTEAIVECNMPSIDPTIDQSLDGHSHGSPCVSVSSVNNNNNTSRASNGSVLLQSDQNQLSEKMRNSLRNSSLPSEETGKNIQLRRTDEEAVKTVSEVINERNPVNEEETALDDSITCIKRVHDEEEEMGSLQQLGEAVSDPPVYSIRSARSMSAHAHKGHSNKSLYTILRGIPWVIGYFSQGKSIEVYVDFDEICEEEALAQLMRDTGERPEKYHIKQNEFYP